MLFRQKCKFKCNDKTECIQISQISVSINYYYYSKVRHSFESNKIYTYINKRSDPSRINLIFWREENGQIREHKFLTVKF